MKIVQWYMHIQLSIYKSDNKHREEKIIDKKWQTLFGAKKILFN